MSQQLRRPGTGRTEASPVKKQREGASNGNTSRNVAPAHRPKPAGAPVPSKSDQDFLEKDPGVMRAKKDFRTAHDNLEKAYRNALKASGKVPQKNTRVGGRPQEQQKASG